jgi:hypothetical protein
VVAILRPPSASLATDTELEAEQAARIAADEALDTALTQSIADEATARANADTALDNAKVSKAANLADLEDVAEVRDNLGLGDAATQDAADLPVSTAQGAALAAKAPNALSLSKAQGGGREYPLVTKYAGNPVATKATAASLGSIYWPWAINLGQYGLDVSGDEWAIYYSTDHSAGAGDPGIGLLTADNPYGPYTDRGVVWRDLSGGTQTETPSVIFNEVTGLLQMYYQQAGALGAVGLQSTCMATSPDGLTWTRVAITHDIVLGKYPGSGHTGYFRPFRFNNTLFGYGLLGSGAFNGFGLSFSTDNGITWSFDPRRLAIGADWLADGGVANKIKWSRLVAFEWRGTLWAIFAVGPNAAGGVDTVHTWWAAPLRGDLRGFSARPVEITPDAQAWESSPDVSLDDLNSVVEYGGKLLFFYRAGGDSGGFGIAELDLSSSGTVPTFAPMPAGAPKRDMRGDIVWPGRIKKVWEESFDSGVLPYWLNVPTTSSFTGQTVVYTAPGSNNPGSARATTSAGIANRQAGFLADEVDLRGLDAIRVTAEGLFLGSDTNTEITLGLVDTTPISSSSGTRGCLLRQTSETSAQLMIWSGVVAITTVPIQFRWKDNQDYSNRHNISLVIFRRTGWVLVMEDDQVWYAGHHPEMPVDGPVTPRVSIKTLDTTARWLDLTQFRVERWML